MCPASSELNLAWFISNTQQYEDQEAFVCILTFNPESFMEVFGKSNKNFLRLSSHCFILLLQTKKLPVFSTQNDIQDNSVQHQHLQICQNMFIYCSKLMN